MSQTPHLLQWAETRELAACLFDESNDALLIFDPETLRLREANLAAQVVTGFRRDELLDRSIDELFRAAEQLDQLLLASRSPADFTANDLCLIKRSAGFSTVNVVLRKISVEHECLGLLVVRPQDGIPDDTVQIQAARALRESENRYRSLVQNAAVCIHEIDLEGRIVSMNPAGLRMVNKACEAEVLGLPCQQFADNADKPKILALLQRALDGEPVCFEFVAIVDGDRRIFSSNLIPLFHDDGSVAQLMGVARDITEQVEVERNLRESEHKFRVISEHCPAMVAIFQNGVTTYANDMVSSISGYSRAEVQAMDFTELVDEEHRSLVLERNRRRMQGEDVPARYEFKLRKKSGEEVWIDFTASLIEYQGKPAVLATALDVTDRHAAEARVRQSEIELAQVARLTTMGELVAGIAHEINQPLSAISNFADACATELGKLDDARITKVKQWAEVIGQQAVRCGDIIRRLRGYVQQKQAAETDVNVNEVIRESIALLHNEIRHSAITIEYDLEEPSARIRGNPVELQQVLVNLLTNANDALQGSDPHQRQLTVRSTAAGGMVRVDVEDNGPGIPAGDLNRLFEAFFSTKPEGLGIGLAISRSIIERHGGHLWAENRTPQGAVFHLELPLI